MFFGICFPLLLIYSLNCFVNKWINWHIIGLTQNIYVNFRLKEVSERWNRYGTGAGSSALSSLRGVRAVAAGPAHIACLLEDGSICRAAFSIIPDRLDLSKADASKSGGNGGGGSGGGGTSGGNKGSGGGGGCGSRQQPRTRARIMRNSIRAAPSSQGIVRIEYIVPSVHRSKLELVWNDSSPKVSPNITCLISNITIITTLNSNYNLKRGNNVSIRHLRNSAKNSIIIW